MSNKVKSTVNRVKREFDRRTTVIHFSPGQFPAIPNRDDGPLSFSGTGRKRALNRQTVVSIGRNTVRGVIVKLTCKNKVRLQYLTPTSTLARGCTAQNRDFRRIPHPAPVILMKRLFKADPRELFDACESGDDVLVKKKLAFSVDVNAIDVTSGQTPLTCAVYKGHTPIVKLLLADKRINVNGVNSLQMTPFLAACHAGIPELVQLLASDRRIDLNAQADGGPTGLHLAFLSKRADLVSIIIQEGMNNGRLDLGLRDGKTGTSALDAAASDPELKKLLDIALAESVNSLSLKSMDLMKACSAGTVNNVKLLLVDPSIDVNFQDKATGATPLIEACLAGHLQIVQLLLADPRCEPNMVIPSLNNQSVVHIVASKGKDKVLALLIKSASGINLNAQDSLGNTPLILACRGKQSKCAELLLKQVPSGRVDLGIMNKEGLMAVDVAEEPERGVICALLPERDGDKVEQNPRGLFGKLRGRTGSGVVSKAETGSGAKVGATDTTTSSSIDTTLNDAFVQACSSGDLITVDTFLSDSAQNPNVASLAMNGWTGFQAACASNQLHVVERLLGDTRVDPNLTDSNGRTGFFIACAGNAEQVISLLLETPVVDVTKPAKGLFGIGGKKPQDAGNAATYKLVKEGVAKRLASSSGLLRLGSRDSGELSKRPSTMDFGGQDQSVPSNEKELPVAHAVLEQMQVQQNGVYNEDASKQPDRGTTVPSPFPVLEPTQPNNPFPPQTTPISSMSTSTALSSSYSSPPPSSTPDLSAVELEARIWRQEEQLFLQEKLRLEEETYRRRLDDEQRFQMKKMEMEEVARGRELQRQKEELRVQRELLNVQEKMARLELLEKEKEGMGREESGATVVGEEAAELLDRAGWVNGLLLSPVDLELEDENKLGEKVTRGRYLGLVDVVARSVDVGDAELVRVVRSWSHVPGHDNSEFISSTNCNSKLCLTILIFPSIPKPAFARS